MVMRYIPIYRIEGGLDFKYFAPFNLIWVRKKRNCIFRLHCRKGKIQNYTIAKVTNSAIPNKLKPIP